MKAVIMAGGEGRRLRPLTEKRPKPLINVCNRSVMDEIIKSISKLGIKEAAVTTMYLADKIKDEFGEERYGVRLKYFREDTPLGTAGSVKQAEGFLDEDFIVVSGDAVFDFDLSQAISAHYANTADCTIVLAQTDDPLEYGVVIRDKENKIKGFVEKPSWSEVPSDLVNTGIYIMKKDLLERIPLGRKYDFAMDFFPKLLEDGSRLYGVSLEGYWCDIGTVEAYYRANFDALRGAIHYDRRISNDLNGCLLAEGACVEEGATAKHCIIDKSSVIRSGAVVSGCIIGKNCEIKEGATVRGSIIDDGTVIDKKAGISPGNVIGMNSRIEEGAVLENNNKLSCGSVVTVDNSKSERTLFSEKSELFSEGKYSGDISPVQAMELGYSACALGERIGIISDPTDKATLNSGAFSCGVCWGGSECVALGEGNKMSAAFAAGCLKIPVFHFGDGEVSAYESNSLPLSHKSEIKIAADRSRKPKGVGSVRYFDGIDFLYEEKLKECLDGACDDRGVVGALKNRSGEIFVSAIENNCKSECDGEFSFIFSISEDCEELNVTVDNSFTVDFDHIRALLIREQAMKGTKEIYIPHTLPRVYDAIAKSCGATPIRFSPCDGDSRVDYTRHMWMRDALMCACMFYNFLSKLDFSSEALGLALDALPKFYTLHDEATLDGVSSARVMRILSQNDEERTRKGVRIPHEKGNVTVTPKDRTSFRIYAEAYSFEAAEELCDYARFVLKEHEKEGEDNI